MIQNLHWSYILTLGLVVPENIILPIIEDAKIRHAASFDGIYVLWEGGWRNAPIAITKVVFPDGHADTNWGTPQRVRVLSEAVTAEETSILHQNVESGTATRSAIDCPTAAKTGTTSELVDAWLDGYTPNYSTVVWMGYPNRRVSMTDVHGEPQQGGYLPAEIWHAYMAAVTETQTCVPFSPSNEPISYSPFFGKYATTGETHLSPEPETGSATHLPGSAPPAKPSHPRTAPAEPRAPRPSGEQPQGPSAAPVPSEPPPSRTGGASPG